MISGGLFFSPLPTPKKGVNLQQLSQSAFNPLIGGRCNLGNHTISTPRWFEPALMALAGCHVQWIHELGTKATERQLRHSNIRTAIFVDVLKQYGVAAVRLQKASSSAFNPHSKELTALREFYTPS